MCASSIVKLSEKLRNVYLTDLTSLWPAFKVWPASRKSQYYYLLHPKGRFVYCFSIWLVLYKKVTFFLYYIYSCNDLHSESTDRPIIMVGSEEGNFQGKALWSRFCFISSKHATNQGKRKRLGPVWQQEEYSIVAWIMLNCGLSKRQPSVHAWTIWDPPLAD